MSSIHDGGFDNGKPTPCNCFETGKLWTYVWTRDTSYATDLALATLDPDRARNSLEFKLSEHRGAGPLAIVQDTGSGGSWPISTDRVVWALGARALLRTLDGDARAAFAKRALDALTTTLELDRAVGVRQRQCRAATARSDGQPALDGGFASRRAYHVELHTDANGHS